MWSKQSRLRLSWLVGFALVGSLGLEASAADRPATRRVAQASPGAGDASMSIMQRVTTDKEKQKFAESAMEEMREGLANLQKEIEDARKAKDIVLLNCLNEKFSGINALLKVTETATILMQQALDTNNSSQADHNFRKIVIARFKARQLLQESRECLGETAGDVRDGEDVIVTVDSGLEGESNLDDPVPPIDTLPPPLSP